MISLFGVADPTVQRALLELSFAARPAERDLAVLEQAIQADALTDGQNRMLPGISQRLPAGGLSVFAESRVRGAFKHTLYRNHLLLDRAQRLRQALSRAGLGECVFLKGVAASLTSPHGLGGRPMADIDLLLNGIQRRPQEVLAFFAEQGMTRKGNTLRSITWLSPERFEFDVHWYLHNCALRQSSVDRLCAHARVVEHAKGRFTIPCVEHNLAHVLAHGVLAPSVQYDGRWAVDALAILVQRPALDAGRFLSFVNEFAVPDAVRIALRVLAEQTPASIEFDRESVSALAAGVRRGRPGSFWLYYRAPGPWDVPGREAHRPLRYHLKTQVRTRLIEPAQVARHNGAPFWTSVGASIDFPSAGMMNFCRLIWRKTRRVLRESRSARASVRNRP
ncbi:nucleotidyltransferase family protein [Pigmentiphaga sp. YJ18]|uniref:nucleotidyltransferase family protein n=1 Tax=Pigmentiphaga sp. YJ18 TaxID=3134907 RepID=UPI003112CEA7